MADRKRIIQFVGLVAGVCISSQAMAQFGGNQINRPLSNPTFSPQLNLLRPGGGVGQNYFGLVKPQIDFAQQNQQLGQNIQGLQMQQLQQGQMLQQSGSYGYSQLGATGHPVFFNSFNTSQFSGGYTGMAGGGFGGGGGVGGGNAGFSQFGGQGVMGGGVGTGFSGVSGHAAQFGGIGNSSRGGRGQ